MRLQKFLGLPRRSITRLQHGQVLILYAFFATALIGMMGLALDLGYNYVQRRALQNAADAAVTQALNDIRASAGLATPGSSNGTCGHVVTVLGENNVTVSSCNSVPAVTCEFVGNNSDNVTGSCSDLTVNTQTSGARVRLSATHATFVMGVLGIASSTISASATGHIEFALVNSAPFLICGDNTMLDESGLTSMWILNNDHVAGAQHEVLPPALDTVGLGSASGGTPAGSPIGHTFKIHYPDPKDMAKCAITSGFWKGDNGPTFPVSWVDITNGTTAGPIQVRARDGCNIPGLSSFPAAGCDMVLPIAESSTGYPVGGPGGSSCNNPATVPFPTPGLMSDPNPNKDVCAVIYATFHVTQVSTNKYDGKLLGPGVYNGNGVLSWTVGSGITSSTLTMRLTQ